MDRSRVSALLSLVLLSACLDPTGERTRRDLEETGWADLGTVRAHMDQGMVVEPAGSPLRFRANAPEVALDFTSTDATEQTLVVQVDNVDGLSELAGAARVLERGAKSLSFEVVVPAGGTATVLARRPELAPSQEFRFGWVGDVQGGYEKFARLREDINRNPDVEFVLFAGDVTQNGTQKEMDDFLAAADALDRPWYSAFGNHETTFGHGVEFQKTVGRLNVAFDYKGVRFVLVDTASATVDERVYDLLGLWLGQPGVGLKIAGMHVPPLDYEGLRDAGFASRAEAGRMLAQLANAGVGLLMCGHMHTLALNGNAGIAVVVSGNGGVGVADTLDGTGMHYLSVLARPDEGRADVSVVWVP